MKMSFEAIVYELDLYLKSLKSDPTLIHIMYRILAVYAPQQSLMQYYPELHGRIDWSDTMARKNSDFNLIEYRLEDAEIATFEKWLQSEKLTPIAALNYCAGKDYKVSMTFVEQSESWCVSLTGKKDAKFNAETTMTTWSDEPFEALFMAVFKASIIFNDGVWKTRRQANRG